MWHLFLVVGLLGSATAVVLARDTRPENLVMISLTVFAAILVGAMFHRTVTPLGGGEAAEEGPMLSGRARAALEREKMLALRSIKELEFDRAMGKIADADFTDMVGRLRARAIGIMRQLDEEGDGYRGLIERDLRSRLEAAGLPGAGASKAGVPNAGASGAEVSATGASGADGANARVAGAEPTSARADEAAATAAAATGGGAGAAPAGPAAGTARSLACAACGTANDSDARFCKQCGAKLDAFAVSM
jgi:hypothetical protein